MPVTITVAADTESAAKRIQEFFSKAGEGLDRLSGASEFLKEWGAQITAAFTVGAFAEFTREAINAAENLKILNETGGFSVKMLSGLREESSSTRAGFEGVSQSLLLFSRNLGEATRNGGQVRLAFRELIGSNELELFQRGMISIDQVLRDAVNSLNAVQDPARKSALAMELFGRDWRDALQVLGSAKFGTTGPITPAMAENASKFNTTLREMKSELENIFIRFASEALPTLEKFASWLKENNDRLEGTKKIAELLAEAFRMAVIQFEQGVAIYEAGFENLIDGAKTLTKAFIELALVSAQSAQVAMDAITGHPVKALQGLLALVKQIGKDLVSGITGPMDLLARIAARNSEATKKMLAVQTGYGKGAGSGADGYKHAGPDNVPLGGGSPGGTGRLTTEAEQLNREIDKAFAESVQGRKAALEAEEKDAIDKAEKVINIYAKREAAIAKIIETYDIKKRELAQQTADAEIQIELAKVQGRRHLVETDPTRSEDQKKAELLKLLKQEHDLLAQNIVLYERLAADQNLTPEAKLQAAKQLQELQQRQAENQRATQTTAGRGDAGFELTTALTSQINAMGTLAGNIATTITSTIGTAVSSVASGIAGWVTGTKRWSDALREIGTGVLTTLVQGFVEAAEKMVVKWIETHVLMKIVSGLFRDTETTANEIHTATQVDIHEGGEVAKTSITGLHILHRNAARFAETIFHGIQIAIRTAAHIAGELAATAASVAQSAVRIAVIVVEAIWWLIKAAFQGASSVADIPYVGWILAIVAIAAIIGAGAAAIAGAFQEGGFTGAGADNETAGVVHRNEFVFSAPAVRRIGVDKLEALHAGINPFDAVGGSARAAIGTNGNGNGGGNVSMHMHFWDDPNALAQHIRKNPEVHHAIVDVARKNSHLIPRRS